MQREGKGNEAMQRSQVEREDAPMTAAPAGSGQNVEGRGRLVTVLGGTGFLGRRVVRHLLDRGFGVRVAARHPERAPPLFGRNEVGAEAVGADVHDEASVIKALADAYGVVNTVSLYVERGGHETFCAVHVNEHGIPRGTQHANPVVEQTRQPQPHCPITLQ
jgi:NAD(P)-dependent dehydrogenase (short-subunit alcohol dehydrogenase family)